MFTGGLDGEDYIGSSDAHARHSRGGGREVRNNGRRMVIFLNQSRRLTIPPRPRYRKTCPNRARKFNHSTDHPFSPPQRRKFLLFLFVMFFSIYREKIVSPLCNEGNDRNYKVTTILSILLSILLVRSKTIQSILSFSSEYPLKRVILANNNLISLQRTVRSNF